MTEKVFPGKTQKGLPFRDHQQNAQYYNLNISKTGDPAILETVQSKSKTFFKEKKDNEDKHGSTLSLNIAAYKRDIFVDRNTVSTPPSKTFVKSWKKKTPLIGSKVAAPFEFPRQQESQENQPELMHFRASQKLLNPNADASGGKKSSLCIASPTGWKQFSNVASVLPDDDLHTLISFHQEVCTVQPAQLVLPTATVTICLKKNEIYFQRASETLPVTALLCTIGIMNIENIDDDEFFNLKIHCQIVSEHLEFVVKNYNLLFEDDEQPSESPEDLVTLITTTDTAIVSEADPESHVAVITPAKEQLTNLLAALKQQKDSNFASPTRPISTSKLHHNLSVRGLCPARITEIRSLIESKQLDLNSVIFHVVNHGAIPDNFEIAKGNQTFAAYLQLKNAKKSVPPTLKCKIYETSPTFGILEVALNANKVSKDQPLSYTEKARLF
uniref:Uncharacterized protein n=1 Tax=Panagrolaimus sp. PS1159 TaxID=55785 RepID=A0AC35FD37_9BILA